MQSFSSGGDPPRDASAPADEAGADTSRSPDTGTPTRVVVLLDCGDGMAAATPDGRWLDVAQRELAHLLERLARRSEQAADGSVPISTALIGYRERPFNLLGRRDIRVLPLADLAPPTRPVTPGGMSLGYVEAFELATSLLHEPPTTPPPGSARAAPTPEPTGSEDATTATQKLLGLSGSGDDLRADVPPTASHGTQDTDRDTLPGSVRVILHLTAEPSPPQDAPAPPPAETLVAQIVLAEPASPTPGTGPPGGAPPRPSASPPPTPGDHSAARPPLPLPRERERGSGGAGDTPTSGGSEREGDTLATGASGGEGEPGVPGTAGDPAADTRSLSWADIASPVPDWLAAELARVGLPTLAAGSPLVVAATNAAELHQALRVVEAASVIRPMFPPATIPPAPPATAPPATIPPAPSATAPPATIPPAPASSAIPLPPAGGFPAGTPLPVWERPAAPPPDPDVPAAPTPTMPFTDEPPGDPAPDERPAAPAPDEAGSDGYFWDGLPGQDFGPIAPRPARAAPADARSGSAGPVPPTSWPPTAGASPDAATVPRQAVRGARRTERRRQRGWLFPLVLTVGIALLAVVGGALWLSRSALSPEQATVTGPDTPAVTQPSPVAASPVPAAPSPAASPTPLALAAPTPSPAAKPAAAKPAEPKPTTPPTPRPSPALVVTPPPIVGGGATRTTVLVPTRPAATPTGARPVPTLPSVNLATRVWTEKTFYQVGNDVQVCYEAGSGAAVQISMILPDSTIRPILSAPVAPGRQCTAVRVERAGLHVASMIVTDTGGQEIGRHSYAFWVAT